jgi:GNAT superfamily N-acetyltransferase
MQPGIAELVSIIDQPGDFIKLCGTAAELSAVLTSDWEIAEPGFLMTFQGTAARRTVPSGYVVEVNKSDQVTEVRILNDSGELAASGYAVETDRLFVYDRIVTEPAHQRKGLGSVVMSTLRASIQQTGVKELLVATDAGRSLYESLGWHVISPFTTASLSTR